MNRPVSSNSGSKNSHSHMGIWPGSSSLASPMMTVLRNWDLLELIFPHLAIPERYNSVASSRQSLLHAGLTCRAFFEPAMNILWREMESFLPLLLVIPLITKEEDLYTSTSVINEADLYRFEFYAKRIRVLRLESFLENVSTHIYMAIAAVFQSKTLFPALTHIHILCLDGISNENFLFFHLITPSPLSTVEVCEITKSNGIRVTSFLNELSRIHHSGPTNSHPLSALSLGGEFMPATVSLLHNFTRLTKFVFELTELSTTILKDVLKRASSLQSLLEFKVGLPEDESEKFRPKLSKDSRLYTFPALQNLHVEGPARSVCDILRSIYGASLSSITFTILPYAEETKNAIPKCIKRCTTMTPSLLDLRINLPLHAVIMDDGMFAPFRSYRLLRSLHVTSLVLIPSHFVDLFDKEFGEWPELETAIFELNAGHKVQDSGTWGLELEPLHLPATSCPKLRKLETFLPNPYENDDPPPITVDTFRGLLDSFERTDHILTELKIVVIEPYEPVPSVNTLMEAKEAILFARVIDHLYPNLKFVELYSDTELWTFEASAWRPWCHGVEMMVKNFQEARSGRRADIRPT